MYPDFKTTSQAWNWVYLPHIQLMNEMIVLVYCCHDVLHAAAAPSGVIFIVALQMQTSHYGSCQEAVKHTVKYDRS